MVLVVDHPHVLITTVAKGSEDKWRDEVSELLELSLRVAMSKEDVRHAARPLYGVHFSLDTRITAVVFVAVVFVAVVVGAGELIEWVSGSISSSGGSGSSAADDDI